MDSENVILALKRLHIPHDKIADAIGRDRTAATKMLAGKRSVKASEMPALLALIREQEPEEDNSRDYIAVDALPSYAGMGGGGNGEGVVEQGLVPRRLVEDELRAKPSELLLLEARGESMAPDFLHGDQILIDKRDCNPVQPGSFALWDGDGYVIKLVERVPHKKGYYRIFSANSRYAAYEVSEEDVRIMGRPVWFARQL